MCGPAPGTEDRNPEHLLPKAKTKAMPKVADKAGKTKLKPASSKPRALKGSIREAFITPAASSVGVASSSSVGPARPFKATCASSPRDAEVLGRKSLT